ncbi:MAG: ATP-dependent zinc metalloprotease FtsH [Bacteroidia bacterium]|nr:ATP-dependent zinc metalloprotease FtsH [Bacteroidia bacterium]MCZ2277098.1 ATP-dependent zinc metalloprotease FtsH [Bacteroidia bacterium]
MPEKDNQSQKKSPGKIPKPSFPKFNFNLYWIYGLVLIIMFAIQFMNFGSRPVKITYDRFEKDMLLNGDVAKLEIVNKEEVRVYIKSDKLNKDEYKNVRSKGFGNAVNEGPHFYFTIGDINTFTNQLKDAESKAAQIASATKKPNELESLPPIDYNNNERSYWDFIISWLLLPAILIFVWIMIMRRMSGGGGGSQIFNIGKSRAQLFDKDMHVKVTFNDVAGLEEAKIEVMEIVDFLKNPKKYTQLGGKIPRGALLVGPPGTGKTLLAKAVAGEAQVPFFSLSGSDFVEMFVGVGASRVRDLFKQAKEKAPSIIFIDEIDAIGRARGKAASFSANDERESTLNQLLTEMDGFGSNSGVIILAATNRADVLDRALLRPGRFDRQIYVELPDLNGRKEIFKVHIKPLKLDSSVDIDFLAKQTPGFSGADIANLCNESALIAARKNKNIIDKQDFLDAVDRIIGGLEKKNKIISQHEKKVIAYHEAGHAAVSWLLEHAHPLVKVTIVPRGNSLGAAWYLPEERSLTTKEQIFDEMCAALGGRASEEITFGTISTGALSDLEKITKQAYASVAVFGLNEKLGNISYYDSSGSQEYTFTKPYSEKTAQVIDEEVSKLIESAYEKTKVILTQYKDKLDRLANRLLDKEVLFKEDLEEIFGKRQWASADDMTMRNEKKPSDSVNSDDSVPKHTHKTENGSPLKEKTPETPAREESNPAS